MERTSSSDHIAFLGIQSSEEIADQHQVTTFNMFFSALIFTMLSFIGSNPIETDITIIRIAEVISLFCLLLAGVMLLFRLGRLKFNAQGVEGWFHRAKNCTLDMILNRHISYWLLFIIGSTLLVINRSALLLLH